MYEAVLGWAREHLDIGDRPVVRPFYPGGDFEHFDYPDNCVVIDNPPFSIFSKICNWYVERGIPFLLFAPAMSSIKQNVTHIGVSCTITYENGANVNTAFVTNMMGDLICTTAPDLHKSVKKANDDNLKQSKKTLAKLSFPDCVLRATTLQTMSLAGVEFCVRREQGCVVGQSCENKKRRVRKFYPAIRYSYSREVGSGEVGSGETDPYGEIQGNYRTAERSSRQKQLSFIRETFQPLLRLGPYPYYRWASVPIRDGAPSL